MPTRTVTRTVTVTEPQIRQAVADWLRHRHSYPAAAADVRVGGDVAGGFSCAGSVIQGVPRRARRSD